MLCDSSEELVRKGRDGVFACLYDLLFVKTTLTLVQMHVCQFKTAIFLWAMAGFLELIFYICGIFKSKTHAADIFSFIFLIVL